jgi:CheY-like chemotaxis protein
MDEKLPDGRYIALEVSDTGCGMDEETLSHIFEPFYSKKFTGRGLGLAVVWGVARAHRAAIHVESAPDQGSTMALYLPFPIAAVESTPVTERPPLFTAQRSETLLVVEDEEMVRRLAQSMLQRAGYTVLAVSDGPAALALLREHSQIAGVLLDLSMPTMSGEETLRHIRETHPALPVLVTSGHGEAEARARFAGQDATGFIQKPFELRELLRRVRLALGDLTQS